MKKHKSKSKHISTSKKVRKELETKLTTAFNDVLAQFGKAKKTDKVIEKFAKQLAKKISISPIDDSITPFIKEEEVSTAVKEEKPLAANTPAKKAKATKVKETA